MLFENKFIKYASFFLCFVFIFYVLYMIYISFFIVKNQYLDLENSTYVNQVREDEYTKKLSFYITKECKGNEICEVQSLLNLVTNIPYKINESIARNSKQVINQNYGDCDDKSNLLISLLKAKNYEAYFVLVPKHIFVIVHLKKKLKNKKALYLNKKAFYILESTAKNSFLGFKLQYDLKEIEAIIDPFKNKQVFVKTLEYKY